MKERRILIEPTFVSTSKSRLIDMQFGGTMLFRIYSKTGKDIEEIAKFGVYDPPNEKEVVFRPNQKFRVLGVALQESHSLISMGEI